MTELQQVELSNRDFFMDILDRLDRIESKVDGQVNEVTNVRSIAEGNKRVISLQWAILMLLVTGVIGLSFFVLQTSLRIFIPGVTA